MNSHDELRQGDRGAARAISPGWARPTRAVSESPDLATVLREALGRRPWGDRGPLRRYRDPWRGWTARGSRDFGSHRRGPTPDSSSRCAGVSQPLRLADLPAYARSLGLDLGPGSACRSPFWQRRSATAAQTSATSYSRRRQAEPEFSGEDERLLLLVASQAAAAIANVRTQCAAERVRAHLEALIETSPVGVRG